MPSLIFREPIAALIGRIRSITKSGISTDPSQKAGTAERDPPAEAEALMRALDNALIREIEGGINNELTQRNLLGAEAVSVLIRYLTTIQIAMGFEETYRLICGSQLNLLTYLNTQADAQPAEDLRPFYTLAMAHLTRMGRTHAKAW